MATLSDPLGLIRPGDSGGGVYLNGQLVGNTWSIYAGTDTKRPSGAFNVALVPAKAMGLLEPEVTRVETLPSTTIAAAGGTQ